MRVRDIMTTAVQVVAHDAPVETAAEIMTTYGVTALPVVDASGRLIGMFSDSDTLWHGGAMRWKQDRRKANLDVRAVATPVRRHDRTSDGEYVPCAAHAGHRRVRAAGSPAKG